MQIRLTFRKTSRTHREHQLACTRSFPTEAATPNCTRRRQQHVFSWWRRLSSVMPWWRRLASEQAAVVLPSPQATTPSLCSSFVSIQPAGKSFIHLWQGSSAAVMPGMAWRRPGIPHVAAILRAIILRQGNHIIDRLFGFPCMLLLFVTDYSLFLPFVSPRT
jgi:hypothetical protein